MAKPIRHVIVGGGITGLLHAWYAQKRGEKVIILEKEDRPGGLIQTKKTDFGLVETAANGIMNSSTFEDLIKELNLVLIPANRASKKRYIYHNNKYRRLPLNIMQKARLFSGIVFQNAQVKKEESLETWGNRILGKSCIQNLLQPAFGGIYAGDVKKMNASLVLKNRVITKGSMLRQILVAKKKNKSLLPKQKGLVSIENGMGSLVLAMQHKICKKADWHNLDMHASISEIQSEYNSQKITIATGLFNSKNILSKEYPDLQNIFSQLEFYNLVTATRFGKKAILDKPAFGVLFGSENKIRARGILFNDYIFSGRVNKNLHSETFIYGGAFDPEITKLEDKKIEKIIHEDRSNLTNLKEKYSSIMIHRAENAMPAYDATLLAFNEKLDHLLPESWRVEGNFRYGIGLSSILERAAQKS